MICTIFGSGPQISPAMNVEIITNNFKLDIYGFAGIAQTKDYNGTGLKLMNKMWATIKLNNLKTNGLNIWVYEQNETVFAGVELTGIVQPDTGLEQKSLSLAKYACFKHIGPYILIPQAGENMRAELARNGFTICFPYIEIYGHWVNDNTKLETELIMALV